MQPCHRASTRQVVAVVHGVPLSIYDGETEYRVGQTVMHPHGDDHAGGLYVSDSIEGCLRRDAHLFPAEVRCSSSEIPL
jgi:hypothetical protein